MGVGVIRVGSSEAEWVRWSEWMRSKRVGVHHKEILAIGVATIGQRHQTTLVLERTSHDLAESLAEGESEEGRVGAALQSNVT